MKRTPLRRKTPLPVGQSWGEVTGFRRLKPLRRKRVRKKERTPEEKAYLAWLHRQPCVVGSFCADPCEGAIEAAHQDEHKGEGLKTPDETCIPLCRRHHREPGVAGLMALFKHRLIHALALREVRRRYLNAITDEGPF